MTNVREEGGPVPRSSNWTGAGLILTSFTDIIFDLFSVELMCGLLSIYSLFCCRLFSMVVCFSLVLQQMPPLYSQ